MDTNVETVENRVIGREDVSRLLRPGAAVTLKDCDLNEADLSGLALPQWTFEKCRMGGVNFQDSDLEGARFVASRGPLANFTGADLGDVQFTACDFNNSTFTESRMIDTAFTGCKLTGSVLLRLKSMGVSFKETLLIAAQLPGVSFRKCRIEKVDFSSADLARCDFRDAVFQGCSLREAHLVDARFEGADLRGADLGGLKATGCPQVQGSRHFTKPGGEPAGGDGFEGSVKSKGWPPASAWTFGDRMTAGKMLSLLPARAGEERNRSYRVRCWCGPRRHPRSRPAAVRDLSECRRVLRSRINAEAFSGMTKMGRAPAQHCTNT